MTFTGYDNYTDTDAYLGELGGTKFASSDYVFPKSKSTVTHTIDLVPALSGTITFTPMGKQVVLIIGLEGTQGKPVLKGDVNLDGEVGIGDIIAITNIMAGDIPDEATLDRADVSGEGDIGIGDIAAITNIMAGDDANSEE
jgi:hypothetical protein